MSLRRPTPKPCVSCPYRQDAPKGLWADSEYVKLARYDRPTGEQPPGMFQCHQTAADDPAQRVCGGWAGVHGREPGHELLALRLAGFLARMDPVEVQATFDYETAVPLWPSGAAAAEHGMGVMSDAARVMARKMTARRADLLIGGDDEDDNLIFDDGDDDD